MTDLDSARTLFMRLGEGIIELDKQFGHASDTTHFVDFCPMANDGEGALWLSTEKSIRNPYYGEMMLGCGEVRETLAPTVSNSIKKKNTTENETGGDR